MQLRKLEQEDTAKSHRTPKNLLEYILHQSINENFFPLLAKHHKKFKAPINCITESPELKSAAFIIDLNGFSNDLAKISEICFEIDNELHDHRNDIKKCHNALQAHSSEELASTLRSIYIDAKEYDEYFQSRGWLPKFDGRPLLPPIFLFKNPFCHNRNLSNEENIFNLVAAFKIHDNFFRNYLNVLYGDGEDGEEFTGKSFEIISSEYKKIKNTIADVLKIIPKSAPEKVVKSVELKRKIVEKTIEKYPATLYLATKKLLLHFENTAATPVALQSERHL